MFTIEQTALRSSNIDADIARYIHFGHNDWVRDQVHATHLYIDPTGGWPRILGEDFEVELAFNYSIITGQEFELIRLLNGMTCQLEDQRAEQSEAHRLSHVGYHVQDQIVLGDDTLLVELQKLQSLGGRVLQISQTTMHKNTSRRYRYAFVAGVMPGDKELLVKVIQRIDPPSSPTKQQASINSGKALFECLAQ